MQLDRGENYKERRNSQRETLVVNKMAISVPVPKDLSGIKTKVMFNLTKRQLVCFSGAAFTGVPLYFLTKEGWGTQVAALLMVGIMLLFFFVAMYERDGFPAEKLLYLMVRQKFLTPGIRPYQSENLYQQLEEWEKVRKEAAYLEAKAKELDRKDHFFHTKSNTKKRRADYLGKETVDRVKTDSFREE